MKNNITYLSKSVFYLFSILFISSCGNIKRVDTTEVKAKMEEYKIKRISDTSIVEWGNEEGEKIAEFFTKNPNLECQDEYSVEGSLVNLVSFDSGKFSHKNKLVNQLVEAYQYSYENQQATGNNLQKIDDSTFVFSFPIPEKTMIFSKCKKHLVLAFINKSKLIKDHNSEKSSQK